MTPDMTLFEPITYDNIHELKPGEWIWDNKTEPRRAHKRTVYNESVVEPIGFRLVHILDIDWRWSNKPFMLSSVDNVGFGSGMSWVCFEQNRFYKFKKEHRCYDDEDK